MSFTKYLLIASAACALLTASRCVAIASDAPDPLLPADPNDITGVFDNGVRYIIRKDANPPGKFSLDLHVNTGSLNETDQQNGLAHFVEHMAFKGSTHFAPMKLIPLLSHLGMTFGADTNAHTNLHETLYKLSMPDNKPETIDTALTIFSDYASGLSFAPIQIESERRVILEEARMRKNAQQRLNKEMNQILFAGLPIGTHDVIGDEEQIKTFPPSSFVEYWNTWYRPENMTLIVAGDIDPQRIIALAKEKLGGFKARAAAREPVKTDVKPFQAPCALVLSDPEQSTADLAMICLKPPTTPIRTVSQFRRNVLQSLAQFIVNRRVSDQITAGNAPYEKATLNTASFLNDAMQVTAEAEGQPKDWNRMLDAMIAQISSAAQRGFTADEVNLAVRGLLAGGEWGVQKEATIDSKQFVADIAQYVGAGDAIMSASQKLALLKQFTADLKPSEIEDVFKEDFDTRNYAYVLNLPATKDGSALPSQSQVLAAATAAWATKSAEVVSATPPSSILADEPAPGQATSRQVDDQLGVTTVTYANGVVMHHKYLDSTKDQVVVAIGLPGGALEETTGNKGVSALASQIVMHPATHRLASTQIRDLMVGKNVEIKGAIGLDAMKIEVAGSPADLPDGLRLVNALLTDGVLEQSAVDQWKQAELDVLKVRATSPKAQLADAFAQTAGAGDIRLSDLNLDQVNRLDRKTAQQWFDQIAQHAAIEITVVGDIQADEAVALIGRYLASLPKRTGTFADLDSLRSIDRPPGPYAKTITFPGITPTAIVMAGYIGCDEHNLDRRALGMASMILTERMIQQLRMKDNLVYSINCINKPGSEIPGLGEIFASAPTDPKNADRLASSILELIDALAATGPTEQELATAKKQIANALTTEMKTPAFWVGQLSTLAYHRRNLAQLREVPGCFQSYTADQVRDVLKKYCNKQREIRLAAVPQVSPLPSTLPASTALNQ